MRKNSRPVVEVINGVLSRFSEEPLEPNVRPTLGYTHKGHLTLILSQQREPSAMPVTIWEVGLDPLNSEWHVIRQERQCGPVNA